MDHFSVLPEGCISEILSLTTPRDACRSSAISRGFKSASDSDTVWERFLPSDYREIIAGSVSPVVFSSKKQLYFTLCDSPVLIDGGKLSFAVDKESGKKCYTLSAQTLSICWGNTPQYWTWISLPESRFSEVAQLKLVFWLDIRGKMKTAMLSSKTTYVASLIFTISDQQRSGFESRPVKASVRLVGEVLDGIDQDEEENTSLVYLKLPASGSSVPRERLGRLPCKRKDGWMEIELGEFFADEGDHGVVEMRLREIEVLNSKSGLIVEGIEIRPKEDI